MLNQLYRVLCRVSIAVVVRRSSTRNKQNSSSFQSLSFFYSSICSSIHAVVISSSAVLLRWTRSRTSRRFCVVKRQLIICPPFSLCLSVVWTSAVVNSDSIFMFFFSTLRLFLFSSSVSQQRTRNRGRSSSTICCLAVEKRLNYIRRKRDQNREPVEDKKSQLSAP